MLSQEIFSTIDEFYAADFLSQNYEFYGNDILNSQKAANAIKNEAAKNWFSPKFDVSNWEYDGKPLS